jgi:glycosyltransferase involved in cell wall biosynthesis
VVRFRGRFTEAARDQVLASLDLLIIPSIGLESFGIVAWEAMAVGTPVIASRLGALADLGGGGRFGGTFSAGNAAELRSWIDRLLEDPRLLESWRAALPRTKTAHDHAHEIDQVYQQVLAPSPGRRSGT